MARTRTLIADYAQAAREAREYATVMHMDVALYKVADHFGHKGFAFHLASRTDSDYARCEIIHPNEPLGV